MQTAFRKLGRNSNGNTQIGNNDLINKLIRKNKYKRGD